MKRYPVIRGRELAFIAATAIVAMGSVVAFEHSSVARHHQQAASHLDEQPCASTCPVHGHHGSEQETPR